MPRGIPRSKSIPPATLHHSMLNVIQNNIDRCENEKRKWEDMKEVLEISFKSEKKLKKWPRRHYAKPQKKETPSEK